MYKIDDSYRALLEKILGDGIKKEIHSGEITSIPFASIEMDMKDGFPLLTTKELDIKPTIDKLLLFLKCDTNIRYINNNIGDLDKLMWLPHNDFQLYIRELDYEERKQIVLDDKLELYDVTELDNFNQPIEAIEEEEVRVTERMNIKNIPHNALTLIWNQHSTDAGLGLPFKIALQAVLLHMLAQQLNMIPDTLIGSLKNVYVYDKHIGQCYEQIDRDRRELPKLKLTKAESIFDYKCDDVRIVDYDPHPPIDM